MEESTKSTHQAIVVPVVLEKHPNADALSIVRFPAGQVVVNTPLWEGKDKGVFIPCENQVDTAREEFKPYAKNSKWQKIKPNKLRGVISQGILIPCPEGKNIGDDLTEYFGIVHCEDVPEVNYGTVKGPSGWLLSKYDIDGPKNFKDEFIDGETVYISQKLHGSNFRVLYQDNTLYVGSRGEWKAESDSCPFWRTVRHNPTIIDLVKNEPYALYGESHGNNKKYRYGLIPGNLGFAAFDIRRKDGTYLNVQEFKDLCDKYNVQRVPELYIGPYSYQKVLDMAEEACKLTGENNAEGCVVKPVVERLSRRFERVCFKVIGTNFQG